MSICINLGIWNSIFAVPCSIVDSHIKLAGSAQLKVLLWVLRHAGEDYSLQELAKALGLSAGDIKDAMQYWIETKVIVLEENKIFPFLEQAKPQINVIKEKTPEKISNIRHLPTRMERPDSGFVANRINSSAEVCSLMQEAQIVLGRPISGGESATLLMLHDTDGLPVDVILMLMQYAVSIGKGNIKYIEKVAIAWGAEEIDTLEKAEQKIKTLESYRGAWNLISNIFGIEKRSATEKENEAADRWINNWQISLDLIKEAYERCVNAKGKYILNYIDSIIKRWHINGIKTLEEVYGSQNKKSGSNKKSLGDFNTSYNLEQYEKQNMLM